MLASPSMELVVFPVTLLPSTLKMKVRSMAPLGPSAVAFHVPLISAAAAVIAKRQINANSHFIRAPSRPISTFSIHRRKPTRRPLRRHPSNARCTPPAKRHPRSPPPPPAPPPHATPQTTRDIPTPARHPQPARDTPNHVRHPPAARDTLR